MKTDTGAKAKPISSGWLAYLDIYGFGAEINTGNLSKLTRRLRAFQNDVSRTLAGRHAAPYIFSDSIVIFWTAGHEQRERVVKRVIDAICTLQKCAHGHDFLLRGAVAYGMMSIGPEHFVGEPLLKAVRMEQRLGIPVVVIPDIELNPDDRSLPLQYKILNVPTKVGLVRAYPILPVPRREFDRWVAGKARKHLREGPDDVAAAWTRLLQFLDSDPLPSANMKIK